MTNPFPWLINGVTFRTRGELENAVERLATAGTRQHLTTAKALLHEAIKQHKLSADKFTEIKERLHL